jgi:hypothetical protein
MIKPGGYPEAIVKERVYRFFFADVDSGNLLLVMGVHDPSHTRVYWSYKSINGATGLFDKLLCYDWALDKWSLIQISGEYIAAAAKPGVTLEGVDTAFGSDIDTLTITSFDDITTASLSALSAFNSVHKLGFFEGGNLAATLETGEKGGDGRVLHINGMRIITDSPDVMCAISRRMTPQAATTYSTATDINTETGVCPAHVTTRYARAKVSVSAGSTWTYAAGVEPDFTIEGRR